MRGTLISCLKFATYFLVACNVKVRLKLSINYLILMILMRLDVYMGTGFSRLP